MPFLKLTKKFRPKWKEASDRVIRNGFRIATFGNTIKDKYTGEFQNDLKHGNGVQYYKNGTVYEGDWAGGSREGHGVLSNNCGHGLHSRIYTGMWEADKPHGFGLRQYDDGRLYKGIFSKGHRHGFGCMYYPNGIIYLGQWVKDIRTGVGRLIRADTRNYYEGMFEGDVKAGLGNYHHVNTGQIQYGVWEENMAKVSNMWDDKETRPIAKKRTLFPIPRLYLDRSTSIFTEAAKPIYENTKILMP